jgi:copper homeostasis protein (lipoprotein)
MDKGAIRRMIAEAACWCSLALFLSGGTAHPASAQWSISGTAQYRERMALPPDPAFEASLEDFLDANAVSAVPVRTRMESPGRPPVHHVDLLLRQAAATELSASNAGSSPIDLPATFTGNLQCAGCEPLRYHLDLFADGLYFLRTSYVDQSPDGFDEIGRWTIGADGRTLELRGPHESPALFEIRDAATLHRLDRAGKPIESQLNAELKRQVAFEPVEPALRMRGLYSYMVDSGWFTECITGMRVPVAKEADNAALEAAYINARPAPGAVLLATVDGRIALRMPMEGPGPRPTLVVDRFLSIAVEPDCGTAPAAASLVNTYWKLVRLGDEAVTVGAEQREPYFILQSLEPRVAGDGGCNRFMGNYAVEANRLTFGPLAGTMMLCEHGMEQEQAFLNALAKVATWRIDGERLELFDAAGNSVVQLESRYLR